METAPRIVDACGGQDRTPLGGNIWKTVMLGGDSIRGEEVTVNQRQQQKQQQNKNNQKILF